MNLRLVKKKFYQEVILDVDGARNTNLFIAREFVTLCLKVLGGFALTLVLAPISLFRPIEIWQMQTRRSKISFFIRDLEFGLQNIKARGQLGKRFVFVLYPIPFPNQQLAIMYRRYLTIIGEKQYLLAECMRFVLRFGRIEKKGRITPQTADRFELWNSRTQTLEFTSREIRNGSELNEELGLIPSLPYVCLAFSSKEYRESADYALDKYNNKGTGKRDNLIDVIPEIDTYVPVINSLTNSRIQVVRTGKFETVPLPNNLGGLVHDYSLTCQSPFGDVWLYSRCLFALAAGSGSHWFASIFNKPSVFTDQFILIGTYGKRDLYIPQLSLMLEDQRLAPFEWMLEPKNFEWALDDTRLGVEYQIVKNSRQQIIDVTIEMVERLNGTWVETKEDFDLQERFRKLYEVRPIQDRNPARIGAKFLREHQHLLPD